MQTQQSIKFWLVGLLVIAVIGSGLAAWTLTRDDRGAAEVRPGKSNSVTSGDGQVTVTIPGDAIQGSGELVIVPVSGSFGDGGWSIELIGTELLGDATIRFALPELTDDEPLPIVTYTDSPGGPHLPAPEASRDGDELVVHTPHFSSWFVTRWSDIRAATLDHMTAALDKASSVPDTYHPKCEDEDEVRESFSISSDRGRRVYWCFGLKNGEPVLRAVNARGYAVAVEYTPGLEVTHIDDKDILSSISTLLVPPSTIPGNRTDLLASTDLIELRVSGNHQVGAAFTPQAGAYLLSALSFALDTVTHGLKRTGVRDVRDQLIVALQGASCLASFSEMATTKLENAHAAQRFFTTAVEMALSCIELSLQAIDVGFINKTLVKGVLWLVAGVKLAANGIIAAADLAFDMDGYQIIISPQEDANEGLIVYEPAIQITSATEARGALPGASDDFVRFVERWVSEDTGADAPCDQRAISVMRYHTSGYAFGVAGPLNCGGGGMEIWSRVSGEWDWTIRVGHENPPCTALEENTVPRGLIDGCWRVDDGNEVYVSYE
jgi:hypothetical protein